MPLKTQSITNYNVFANVRQGGRVKDKKIFYIHVRYDKRRDWNDVCIHCMFLLQSC